MIQAAVRPTRSACKGILIALHDSCYKPIGPNFKFLQTVLIFEQPIAAGMFSPCGLTQVIVTVRVALQLP